jgi:enoyl-CoA hydratase/carnithine racemase
MVEFASCVRKNQTGEAGMAEVQTSVLDGVATVTINRPDRRNTLSQGVVQGLREAFLALDRDASVKVVVLTGAGEKAFCAGGDVTDFASTDGMLAMHWARAGFAELMKEMQELSKPLIARVNGLALGGGFGLVLNCDLAVASDTAEFGTPEIKLGLFPMMIMAVMVRNLGRKDAMELMLTGERIDAGRAKEMGVVNQVVAAGALDEATMALARKVAGYSPAVLRLGRQAFYKTQDMGFSEALATLHNELSLNVMSEDAAEGVMAFMGRRDPKWTGR